MSNTLGTIRGQMILDVKQALDSYTAVRQANVSTVTALHTGAGALATAGAAVAGAGALMAGGILTAVSAAAEFERKLDFFGAVSGATQKEYDAIRQKAIQLGADTIYSANQIADSFVELSKSGVSTKDILDGIGEAVANLGASTDMPLADAAKSLTTILNTFGIAATDAVSVVDKLAGAANASSIDVQDLITTMTYAGASAKTAGISFEDVNNAIALLGERGIKGSKAGTGLRQMFDKLIAPTNQGANALKELGIVLDDGTNKLLTMEGGLKPIPQLLDILNGATANLSTSEKMDVLGRIFPITSLPTILNLLDGGSAALARMNAEVGKTTALDVASQRLDNLSGDLEILRGNLDTLFINSGSNFQSFARTIVQGLTDLVQGFIDLPAGVQTAIFAISGIGGAALIGVGSLGMFAGALLNLIAMAKVLGPALTAVRAAIVSVTGALKLMAIAMLPPQLAIIIGILALVAAALTVFFTQTEQGRAIWAQFMAAIQAGIAAAMPVIMQLVTTVGGALVNAFNAVMPILANVISVVGGALATAFTQALPFILSLAQTLGGFLSTALQAIVPLLGSVLQALTPFIQAIIQVAAAVLQYFAPVADTLAQSAGQLATAFAPVAATFTSQLLPALSELGAAFSQIIAALMPIVVTVVTQLLPALSQLGMTVLQLVAQFLPLIAMLMGNLVPIIVQIVTTLLPPLMQLFMALVPIITQIVGIFAQLVGQLLGMLVPVLMQIITAIMPVLMAVFQAVVPIIQALATAFVPLIQTLVEALIPVIQFLLEVITTVFQAIAPIIDAALKIVVAIIQTITAALKGDWEGVWNGILAILQGVWNLILSVIQGTINAVVGIWNAFVSFISSVWNSLWSNVTSFLRDAMNNIVNGVSNGINAVGQFFQSLPGKIMGFLSGIGSWLLSAGNDLIQGLVNGISNAAGAVMDAIGGVVEGAIDWAKGLLGIHSPSRVFDEIGDNTIQGLVNGIAGMMPGLKRQMTAVADEMTQFYSEVSAAKQLDMQLKMGTDLANGAGMTISTQNDDLATMRQLLQELKDTPRNQITLDVDTYNPVGETTGETITKELQTVGAIIDLGTVD